MAGSLDQARGAAVLALRRDGTLPGDRKLLWTLLLPGAVALAFATHRDSPSLGTGVVTDWSRTLTPGITQPDQEGTTERGMRTGRDELARFIAILDWVVRTFNPRVVGSSPRGHDMSCIASAEW